MARTTEVMMTLMMTMMVMKAVTMTIHAEDDDESSWLRS